MRMCVCVGTSKTRIGVVKMLVHNDSVVVTQWAIPSPVPWGGESIVPRSRGAAWMNDALHATTTAARVMIAGVTPATKTMC